MTERVEENEGCLDLRAMNLLTWRAFLCRFSEDTCPSRPAFSDQKYIPHSLETNSVNASQENGKNMQPVGEK
jgi:hypothetical protein